MKRIVRYTVKPEHVEENAALVRAVFEELDREAPEGLEYSAYVEVDGTTFVHVASIATEDGRNPLTEMDSFQRFQSELTNRCAIPPTVLKVDLVASYKAPPPNRV